MLKIYNQQSSPVTMLAIVYFFKRDHSDGNPFANMYGKQRGLLIDDEKKNDVSEGGFVTEGGR